MPQPTQEMQVKSRTDALAMDAGTPQCRRMEVGIVSKEATTLFAANAEPAQNVEIIPTPRYSTGMVMQQHFGGFVSRPGALSSTRIISITHVLLPFQNSSDRDVVQEGSCNSTSVRL